MRAVFIVTVLMLAPLAQGIGDGFSEIKKSGSEQILHLDEGVWGQEEWDNLDGSGFTPLRLLDSSKLLVWRSAEYLPLDGFEILQSPSVELRLETVSDEKFEQIRVVFEPRLPSVAAEQIVSEFASFGVQINDDVSLYARSTPHIETIDWRLFNRNSAIESIHGILWIEPVLETKARNGLSGSLLQHGLTTGNPSWELGLNGKNVVVGMADSGIDYDHSCFRNATAPGEFGSQAGNGVGEPGENHRKIQAVNHSIDEWDTPGHQDYRHGTHVAGTLVCHDIFDMRENTFPENGSSLSYGAKLVFQDIVNETGWVPPDVDELFVEAGVNGAVIHSNSWGDATTAYTARTGDFDSWALEMPWSLAFVAPGNNGGQLMEPSNGRNVVAVGASMKSQTSTLWPSSSIGPTEAGTNGIFVLAPGASVQSARSDGIPDSYNSGLRSSSGTSMATPAAAGVAAVIQQLIEEGWISGDENRVMSPVTLHRPSWVDSSKNTTNSLDLAEGFTPSGPMLRSLMAMATTPLSSAERNGGQGGSEIQNIYDGWGQFNLSELIDLGSLEAALHQGNVSPAQDVWIHDSFRLKEGTPADWLNSRNGGLTPLENLLANPWNGSESMGPFLKSGDVWKKRFEPTGQDLDVRLAWSAPPEPHLIDDLQLVIKLSNGETAIAGKYQSDGDSTLYSSSIVDFSNQTLFPQQNETTTALSLSEIDLEDVEWIEIEVRARYVSPGNSPETVGIDGNRVGFALAVQGVVRDSILWLDGDGDGVLNIEDECPNEDSSMWDNDLNGCIDDGDGDGVKDPVDECPTENSTSFDRDGNGCIDDSDFDGVLDNVDQCQTQVLSPFWPVNAIGCRPIDTLPSLDFLLSPDNGSVWYDELVVEWMASDAEGDLFDTGARIIVLNSLNESGSYSIASCMKNSVGNGTFSCAWSVPKDLPVWDIRGEFLQIELYVETRNNSPEAKNDLVLVRDDAVFSSDWNNPLLSGKDDVVHAEEGAGSQGRALLWGILGIITGFVLMYQMGRGVLRKNDDENVPPAFEDVWSGLSAGASTENE